MKWYELSDINYIKHDCNTTDDVIYLDFGHGGSDPGCAFYDGTKEKDYNLKFGMAVYKILKPYFKNIYLTRTTDKTVTSTKRIRDMTAAANGSKMLHVYSIHCNAFNKVTRGAMWLLSKYQRKTGEDYIFCSQFLRDYNKEFGIPNKGIVQRKLSNGEDYYYLHRETPDNCKSKIIELFFGDNRTDCKLGQTSAYFDKATFFVASYILKRYNIKIDKPQPDKISYYVQAGAFSEYRNAQLLVEKLKKAGFDSIIKKT